MVEIAVRDHGAGVPPEQAVLLFQRFVRLERDIASRVTGTGLGLAICRAYVEAMGGRIWVESTGVAGEGATFLFTLPAAEHAIAPAPQEDEWPWKSHGQTHGQTHEAREGRDHTPPKIILPQASPLPLDPAERSPVASADRNERLT